MPLKKTLGGISPPKKDTSGRFGEDDPMRDWPNLRKVPARSEWAALLSPDADQGKDLDSQGNPRPLQDHLGGSHRGTVTPPSDTPQGRRKERQGERGAGAPPHRLTELSTEGAQDGLPGTLSLCEEEPKDPTEDEVPGQSEKRAKVKEPRITPPHQRPKRAAITAQPVPPASLNAFIQSPSSGHQDAQTQGPIQHASQWHHIKHGLCSQFGH